MQISVAKKAALRLAIRHTLPRVISWLLLLALVLLTFRLYPKPAWVTFAPQSKVMLAADGTLLRFTLAGDQQFRPGPHAKILHRFLSKPCCYRKINGFTGTPLLIRRVCCAVPGPLNAYTQSNLKILIPA